MVTGSSPIFAVTDVPATVKFYTEVLGFTGSWTWGEPVTFGAATWGRVTIMFGFSPELAEKIEGHAHWFDVEAVDDLYARHVAAGAVIASPIEDKPWGRREYIVRDLNGYFLRFAGNPVHESKGTGEFPPGVEVVTRMPTHEEMERVLDAAFDKTGAPAGVLDRTWKCVVSTAPGGEAIGMLRIVYDAPGWFSIWDVGVMPEWQGRRIGTAMMNAALELVREECPGAWVHLFTYKGAFYERLGFGKEGVHMRKV